MTLYHKITIEARELIVLGLPLAIAELSGVLLNIIDTAMIGGLGSESVAAVSIASSVFLQIALLGIGTMVMSSPRAANAYEQRNFSDLKRLLWSGIGISVALALLLGIILCIANLNFHWLQQTPVVTSIAKSYLWAISPNLFFILLYLHLVHFTDGLSMTRVGMTLSITTLVIHIFLNWLLIYGNAGFPKLGVVGAGISTSISQGITAIMMLVYLLKDKAFAKINTPIIELQSTIQYAIAYFKSSVLVGIQIEVEYLAWSVGATWMGWIGAISLAAHQIAVILASSTFMIMLAIGTAGGIRIGQATGANDTQKMRVTGMTAIILGMFVAILPAMSYIFLPHIWASAFISELPVIKIAIPLIVIAGFFQFFDAIQAVSLALLRGRNDTYLPSLFSLIAYWMVGMPLGYYLTFTKAWGAVGIWTGFLCALILQSFFFVTRFFWKLGR